MSGLLQSSSGATGVVILLFSLVALGTWPALLDLSNLFGKHPTHSYLEYATSVLIVASLIAIASGVRRSQLVLILWVRAAHAACSPRGRSVETMHRSGASIQ